jgi:hypothetical protein
MTARACFRFSSAALAVSLLAFSVACGSPDAPAPAPATSAPAASSAPAPAASPAAELKIIEPAEGSSSGHIGLFSWTAVAGADGYRMHLAAATDNRTVWDSPVLTTTEAHLPNTVALEPEAYVWQVTALKGTQVLATSPLSRFTVTP